MKPAAFAARRSERLTAADDDLRPLVRDALRRYANGVDGWSDDLLEAASVLWLEHFQAEAPRADPDIWMPKFQEALADSFTKTSQPDAVESAQVERVTRWVSLFAVNAGTHDGAGARGGRFKRWGTMNDDSVRETHQRADGQVVAIGGTFDIGGYKVRYPGEPVGPPEVWMNCRCLLQPTASRGEADVSETTFRMSESDLARGRLSRVLQPLEQGITAAGEPDLTNPDGTPYTGALIVLVPAVSDPVVAASSEPAHLTTIWFGELADMTVDMEELEQAVRLYAADLDGPVVVPARERGTLGDDDADVVFLEPTDALLALRDGLLANEPIKTAHDAVEQYPEWTPHVTLGYPDRPAVGEYDATEVTFDRIALWLGGEHFDYPMGGTVDDEQVDEEMPPDELEEGEEEVTEIPVHGIATIEGRPTGDGRQFALGALTIGQMPQPLGYEFEHGHGSDNSRVAVVGRIDEFIRREIPEQGINEIRWRGVIMPAKEYAAQAIESIIDGSYTGVSVVVDDIEVDVEQDRAQMVEQMRAQRDAMARTETVDAEDEKPPTDEEIEALVDAFVGDGKMPVTTFKSARVRRFDMVPTGAYQEAYTALGHEFEDEMDAEAIAAAATALEDCGCLDGIVAGAFMVEYDSRSDDGPLQVGPFETREGADAYAESLAGDGFDASWSVVELAAPTTGESIVAAALTQFAPGTKDGPGWITHPQATSRIRKYWVRGKGAAKIAWGTPGDFNRCRSHLAKYVQNPDWLAGLCANMHKEATGTWPGQKRGDKHAVTASAAAPLVVLASAWSEVPAWYFEKPQALKPGTGVKVDGDHVYGYVAHWGVCHIGVSGACTTAPSSPEGYPHYRTGVVHTDDGRDIAVGQITMDTGHASIRASGPVAAAHYDNTGACVADVVTGEDAYGIWYSGRVRPDATEKQRYELEASGMLSGDWRQIGGVWNLVAALVVNTAGFPKADVGFAASAHGGALVAAGIVTADAPTVGAADDENEQYLAALIERGVTTALSRIEGARKSQAARERMASIASAEARRRLSERIA